MAEQRQVIAYELPDGSIVHVEGVDTTDGYQRVSRDETVETATQSFQDTLSHLAPAVQTVMDSLREINHPSEIGLEFGVKFNVKTGVLIASAGSEVAFKISLKWQNDKAQNDQPSDPST